MRTSIAIFITPLSKSTKKQTLSLSTSLLKFRIVKQAKNLSSKGFKRVLVVLKSELAHLQAFFPNELRLIYNPITIKCHSKLRRSNNTPPKNNSSTDTD